VTPPDSSPRSPEAKADSEISHVVATVWRMEFPRIVAAVARMLRDVGRAEELAQDALVAALEQWPRDGVPTNPGAWLMTAAKRRALDDLRRRTLLDRKHEQLKYESPAVVSGKDLDAALDEDVGDDLLRLMFTACHPLLATDTRVALTLRMLGGLTTDEIARAFLVPEATIAQRIVRAKKTLAKARVPFEVPRGADRAQRLGSVLEVIYLVFNEGYAATAGEDLMRPGLCDEALRLGRVLAGLAPEEPEVHGLVALMEIQASRARARVDAAGAPVLLLDQNRSVWDRMLIARGLAALGRAERLGGARGPYALQAAIAACHARALTPDATDWPRIAALYSELAAVVPSPVVELNRAVAVGMASSPQAALDLVDALRSEPALARYHLVSSVRGDLLFKLARFDEAREEFERAASLTRNAREREQLLALAAEALAKASESPMTTQEEARSSGEQKRFGFLICFLLIS
jgi:RNA polymerase sigma-70 factor (ECF subfamily)